MKFNFTDSLFFLFGLMFLFLWMYSDEPFHLIAGILWLYISLMCYCESLNEIKGKKKCYK
ncbi:hypothetical protein LCGC14_2150310 [marine sediment metagenome]|uniref:Uncharacterized protein n=1 Tax=marine sediment metagenome TaxID=412755 RepID=A0A0F9GS33_9ZZZZ